jgi:glycosyltransferase involved in cell wall biosynthesis
MAGLTCHDGKDILIANSPEAFARACLDLLERAELRRQIAGAALNLVATQFSWEAVSRSFEAVLLGAAAPLAPGE